MFRLLKWLLFLALIVVLIYGVSFYRSLDDKERLQTRKDAAFALETGEIKAFTSPLFEKIKEDVQKKKTSFFQIAREKIKNVLNL